MNELDKPFTQRRVLRFGDCDAAGVIYTPRALVFAYELLESWYRDVAGASWGAMPESHGMNAPTVHYEADCMAPLMVDTDYELRLWVSGMGQSSVNFVIDGVGLDELLFFRIKVVSCFVSLAGGTRKSAPVPDDIRGRIQDFMDRTGTGPVEGLA